MSSIFEDILLEGPKGWDADKTGKDRKDAEEDYYTNKAVVTRSLGRKPTKSEDKRMSLMVARNVAVRRHNAEAEKAAKAGDQVEAAKQRYKAERLAVAANKSIKPINDKINRANARQQNTGFGGYPKGRLQTSVTKHRPIGFNRDLDH